MRRAARVLFAMRRSLLIPALVLAMLPADGAPPPGKAAWTVLVYLQADNDLEHTLVENLGAMAAVKLPDSITVVVQCDRSEKDAPEGEHCGHAAGGVEAFHGVKRFRLAGGRLQEEASLGAVNSCDPKTLAEFIAWGVKSFPAERTCLVLADHGLSWPGWGIDESAGNKGMSLKDLDRALAEGCKAGGIERLDLLGFDCCLMGSLDVMAACRAHARRLVASEELEPGQGWNYPGWMAALAKDLSMDADALGKAICDAYKASFDASTVPAVKRQGDVITLAVVDLERIPAVMDALGTLARGLAGRLGGDGAQECWDGLAQACQDAEEYGRSTGASCAARDLSGIARRIGGAEAAALGRAIEAAVRYRVAGKDRPEARGISLYFPPTLSKHDKLKKAVKADYADAAACADWPPLLTAFFDIETQDTSPPEMSEVACSASEIGEGESTTITADLSAQGLASASLSLGRREGGVFQVMGLLPVEPEDGRLSATFDGTWLALGDAEHQVPAAIASWQEVEGREGVYLVEVPVVVQPSDSEEWEDVTLYLEIGWSDGEFTGQYLYAFREGEQGQTPIAIDAGDRVAPCYAFVDEHGEQEWRQADTTLEVDEDGLCVLEESLPAGDWDVGFLAEDLAGNVAEDYVTVTVKGD